MDDRACGCALKCFDVLTQTQRKNIFSGFWELASYDTQNAYLCGGVKVLPVKRHYKASDSRRGNTRVYYVHNGERSVRVCKVAFLRLHGVSSGRLTRLLSNQAQHGGVPKLDSRGHKEPPNKTSEEDLAFVRSHIDSFPVYESHYSRSDNPDRKYLSPDLSVSKMHYLYKEKCDTEVRRSVSDWVYRKVFNEEYNLSFGRCVTILPPHTHTSHTPPPHTHSQTHLSSHAVTPSSQQHSSLHLSFSLHHTSYSASLHINISLY